MLIYTVTEFSVFIDFQSNLEDDIVESDGEADCPNPADFLEACLVK